MDEISVGIRTDHNAHHLLVWIGHYKEIRTGGEGYTHAAAIGELQSKKIHVGIVWKTVGHCHGNQPAIYQDSLGYLRWQQDTLPLASFHHGRFHNFWGHTRTGSTCDGKGSDSKSLHADQRYT